MNDALVLQFHRAAGQRLSAARVLLTAAETLDAQYLGGYGLECSLKSLILARTPANERRAVFEQDFRGSVAHQLDWMIYQLHRRNVRFPPTLLKALRRCSQLWYVELRYETGRRKSAECRFLLETAESLWAWTRRQIQ